jgi:hypothetical protein
VRAPAWRNSQRRGGCPSRRKSGGRRHNKKVVGAIAHRASTTGEGEIPIRIGAQILRDSAGSGARPSFELAPDETGPELGDAESREPAWQQAHVRRAIEAAEEAGLRSYRIEITPEGTITIVVETPGDPARGS